MKDYGQYTLQDFADDASFRRYVAQTHAADVAFWADWLATHPEKATEAESAASLLRELAAEAALPTATEAAQQAAWRSLQQTLGLAAASKPTFWQQYRWGMVALVVGLTAALGYVFGPRKPLPIPAPPQGTPVAVAPLPQPAELPSVPAQRVTTAYGRTRQLHLPDGSVVLLNGNSSLRYDSVWPTTGDRVVWLEGEAEFRVTSQHTAAQGPRKFLVRTDRVTVEVLGTRFNLRSRGHACKVALYEGKVNLYLTQQPEKAPLRMDPQQVAQLEAGEQLRVVPMPRPDAYQAWTKRQFVFDDTPLAEVAEAVEGTYGVRLEFAEASLSQKRLTASLPVDDVEVLARVIDGIFSLQHRRQGQAIYFEKR